MTVQEEAKAYRKFRNEEALEYCRKQSMLEQMVGNETWKHYDTASKALEEVEQYRALGTVEELKEAREKQIPKKLIKVEPHATNDIDVWVTCECGATTLINKDYKHCYCWKCGQLIELPQPYKKEGAENGEP